MTFFFNDYRESPKSDDQPHPGAFDHEDDWEVRSPTDVSTYDQKPEMSALEVTDAVLQSINSGECPPTSRVDLRRLPVAEGKGEGRRRRRRGYEQPRN